MNQIVYRDPREKYQCYLRGQMVAICEALLNEDIGVVNASRRLTSLGHELWENPNNVEGFTTFVAIESETDHLPVDKERHNWNEEALERKDKEIAEAEQSYRDSALQAASELLLIVGPSRDLYE